MNWLNSIRLKRQSGLRLYYYVNSMIKIRIKVHLLISFQTASFIKHFTVSAYRKIKHQK
jgi:hypothetical protein